MSTTSQKKDDADAFDARRRLCPDGACIGVLDQNGRCKVCGLNAGGTSAAASSPISPAAPEPPENDDAAPGEAPMEALPLDEGESPFDPARRLCPDGACTGVLGADGRCKVCGRTGEG
jgi:hypothetical protein